MTQNIKNNMSSSCLTRRSGNKDLHADWIPDRVGDDRRAESGRSMTEMLGVLAVIGVLSVGSIAGYRYAMDKYYTNEILAGASQRAVLVAAQISAGQTLSLAEFSKMNDTAGGTFDSTVKEWDGEFGIKVTKVKESVCKKLVKATKDTDIILTKTDGSNLTESNCRGDNNTFLFVYSNDMSGEELDESAYACWNEDCGCIYGGTYPKCHAKPACINSGSCSCMDAGPAAWDCKCIYGGTYPNCTVKPTCANDGSCSCNYYGPSGGWQCGCPYGGTYPNNCIAKPACLDNGACSCTQVGADEWDCDCTNGGTYPSCNAQSAS